MAMGMLSAQASAALSVNVSLAHGKVNVVVNDNSCKHDKKVDKKHDRKFAGKFDKKHDKRKDVKKKNDVKRRVAVNKHNRRRK